MIYLTRTILLAVCLTVLSVWSSTAQTQRSNSLFEIKVDGKTGFIDRTGKVVIEPKLGGVYEFSEGLAAAYIGKGQFDEGYIDESGAIAIEPKFNIAGKFSEGLAWVGIDPNRKPYKTGPLTLYSSQSGHSFDYNIGFIDRTGRWLTEPIYTFARDFSEGLSAVRTKENKFGFIDKSGKLKIEAKFDWAESFSNGLAAVFFHGKHGFIDKEGRYVVKPKYANAHTFSEGLACVKIGGRVYKPSFGVHLITTGGEDLNYGYIDVTGRIVFRIRAFGCQPFSEGLARVEINGKWGFIDKTGRAVFSSDIDAASDFSEGLARVFVTGESGGFGFIDHSGKVVLISQFPFVSDFKNGLAQIADNIRLYDAGYGYIDKTGTVIWPPTK